jgi:hypothetical protein
MPAHVREVLTTFVDEQVRVHAVLGRRQCARSRRGLHLPTAHAAAAAAAAAATLLGRPTG